ncbi:hypothetical protein RIF29_35348 [Crotalaria pallida]|uniref:Uncharacterized protein n=1 Tax=Crotalaria pallida TaxID=3830 RepID=A0AAN9E9T3_CROPI
MNSSSNIDSLSISSLILISNGSRPLKALRWDALGCIANSLFVFMLVQGFTFAANSRKAGLLSRAFVNRV